MEKEIKIIYDRNRFKNLITCSELEETCHFGVKLSNSLHLAVSVKKCPNERVGVVEIFNQNRDEFIPAIACLVRFVDDALQMIVFDDKTLPLNGVFVDNWPEKTLTVYFWFGYNNLLDIDLKLFGTRFVLVPVK